MRPLLRRKGVQLNDSKMKNERFYKCSFQAYSLLFFLLEYIDKVGKNIEFL